jgi:alkylhydroperoxidase/carboxymuconolactone decarboxylase family protein YurZ
MRDLTAILSPDSLRLLRAAYDHDAMTAQNVRAVAALVPAFAAWNEEIGRTFYGRRGPLQPRDRERCLIGLMTASRSALPLAIHVYWGLMEGLSVEEIVEVVGLTACYSGMPGLAFGLNAVTRTFEVLAAVSSHGGGDAAAVLEALVRELSSLSAS